MFLLTVRLLVLSPETKYTVTSVISFVQQLQHSLSLALIISQEKHTRIHKCVLCILLRADCKCDALTNL